MTNQVLMNLPLDEMVDGQLFNLAKPAAPPILEGSPQIVPDDQFGSCLRLNGSADGLILANPFTTQQEDFTLTCWIWPDDHLENYDLMGQLKSPDKGLQLWVDNGNLHYSLTGLDGKAYSKTLAGVIKPQQWQHLAWVKQDAQMTLYLDQVMMATSPVPKPIQLTGEAFAFSSSENRFAGKVAHICCFDGGLTSAQLINHIHKTQNATSTFKLEYPMAFSFSDDGARNSFFISDSTEINRCQLTLENTSDQRLLINGQNATDQESKAHFQLKFKPNTFQETLDENHEYIKFIDLPKEWASSPAKLDPQSGQISIGLSYAGKSDLPLAVGGQLIFDLEYASADGTAGARGTNVELIYQSLSFPDGTALSNSRIISAEIINQRGKQQIPLQVGIIGPNKILNNADRDVQAKDASSTIRIRIANGLKPDPLHPQKNSITLNTGQVNKTKNTQFSVLFDDPVGHVWDLANLGELKAIQAQYRYQSVNLPENKVWINLSDASGSQGQSPVFTFQSPTGNLSPGDYIEIELNNIRTSSPSGFSNIYLQYEDVPGYWDGQFVLQVEKSPMIFSNGNIGIGTTNPKVGVNLSEKDMLVENGTITIIKEENGGQAHGRTKIRLWKDPFDEDDKASHAIGTEPFYNAHGPGKNCGISIGHRFYVHGDELAAELGKGGEGTPENNTRVHFPGNVGIGTDDPKAGLSVLKKNIQVTDGSVTVTREANGTQTHGRSKLRLWQDPTPEDDKASHAIGTEPYYNAHGPGKNCEISIGHRFYVHGDELAAEIGKGGPETSENNTRVHFPGNVGIGTDEPKAGVSVLEKDIQVTNGSVTVIRQENEGQVHGRSKLRLWEDPTPEDDKASHAIGTEPFYNAHGPGENCKISIGHRFYVHGNALAAELGKGGPETSENNTRVHFPGKVGIGSENPKYNLEVNGTVQTRDTYVTGKLGVNTTNPKRAKIDIVGHEKFPPGPYGYLSGRGKTGTHDPKGKAINYSLFADDRIACHEFNTVSDRRVKEVSGISDKERDLTTLNQIEITDYQYKDDQQYGSLNRKKVIGQQIAEVYPHAVSLHNDVIPDIMQKSTLTDGKIPLQATLKKGDSVKLIFPNNSHELVEVLQVSANEITVDHQGSGEVFVYGREVDDFHVVDYDAISMLNVSATQQLHTLFEQQKKEFDRLTQRLQTLEQELEIKKKEIRES